MGGDGLTSNEIGEKSMKERILTHRLEVTHNSISSLPAINAGMAITDYDAFVFDPAMLHFESMDRESLVRRQTEIVEIIRKKGGIIVCFLRQNTNINVPSMIADRYSLLKAVDSSLIEFVSSRVQLGEGKLIKMTSARGASSSYFQILKGSLCFEAYLRCSEQEVIARSGKILAFNSVGYPIAVEFSIGEGAICFLPLAQNVPSDRMGAAIAKIVRSHFEKQGDTEMPPWSSTIEVPGAKLFDDEIAVLKEQREKWDREIDTLEEKRESLTKFGGLLYGYGKVVLERQVRAAFRLFGFTVSEPEDYSGEWDVFIVDPSGRTAIGEVEGSEGFIDVDKYRQLLDYVEAEALDGRDHKGILIGNGFRLLPPDAAERQQQFSDHALRGAARNSFCLLPTTEMFKAVCAVLETPDDGNLKSEIRDSILRQVGVWTFVRQATPTTAIAASDATAKEISSNS
jgi:hypothetical protein